MIKLFIAVLAALAPTLAFAAPAQYDITIDKMTCGNCAKRVAAALAKIKGVDKDSVKVDFNAKNAKLTVAEDKKELVEQIKAAVESASYTVIDIKIAPRIAPH